MSKLTIAEYVNKLPWNKKMVVLRISNGWTQEEAAERCNTHAKIYWLWENAKNNPRKNSKIAISKAFGVSVNEIFGELA